MEPIEVVQDAPDSYYLTLVAGATDVDDVIVELGHEPNGEFWNGIVELLVMTEAPELGERFQPDPEAGAYLAYSDDRAVLDDLAARLTAVATDADRVRRLVDLANARGFEFDD
jgi:hypothetical protein